MKITITGSLGNISFPLAINLIKKGHDVTVISSNPQKKTKIEAIGATPAIGTIEDTAFLTTSFTGADAVFTMIPPGNYMDKTLDIMTECRKIGNNFAQAIRQSGVKRVVHLSSIGAHLDHNSGLLLFHHLVENILKELPSDISITFMRPAGFYNNLFSNIDMIKDKGVLGRLLALRVYGFIPMLKGQTGVIIANYGKEDKTVWVSPKDIAVAIVEELETLNTGREVRYVASDELTCNEVAGILGTAIGKPYLEWGIITDKQMQSGLERFGMQKKIAAGMVEMYAGVHSGIVDANYYQNRPAVMGKVKMTDFAKDFAIAYNKGFNS